ncbi:MAG: hypothetical protein ACOCO9_11295, partial [Segatella copri]
THNRRLRPLIIEALEQALMETQKQKGEGWVKSGEELMKPFTVISVLYIVLYVMLVKGEGCF